MHFAGPPRKTPYTAGKPHTIPFFRRVRLRTVLWIIGVVFVLYMLFSWLRGGNPSATAEIIPEGTPPVVLVTTFDTVFGSRYEKMIKDNREAYAARHGSWSLILKSSIMKLTLLECRLRNVLRQNKRLHSEHGSRLGRIASSTTILVQSPSHAPRHERISPQHLLLLPLPTLNHHASRSLRPRAHHDPITAARYHDSRPTSRAT